MTLRLSVAHGLAPLADALADELARPGSDPFAREMVAVPGDGVRAWLVARLATLLGVSSPSDTDGIVANVDFVFPAKLVRLALGESQPTGAWSVGPLTWAIYEVLQTHGAQLGQPGDVVHARAVADLFDRYTLHRPAMVRQWEAGRDLDAAGQTLAQHLQWQPALWRLLLQRLGGSSDAVGMAVAAAELRVGRRTPLLPDRVFLFGLASLPLPHLAVLSALSAQRSVHVLAPAPSLTMWRRVQQAATQPLTLPVLRTADPTAGLTANELAASWGRAAREAHLLLAGAAVEAGARIELLEPETQPETQPVQDIAMPLLVRLQHHVRADQAAAGIPAAAAADTRPQLQAGDRSVQWHRCHGLARQVEVARDVVLRLLTERQPDGTPRYLPRDIAILCPDPAALVATAEAVFAGDPPGLPAVPMRVADRSLRTDNPLLDTVAALLELLDGRFRASDVLAFAARPPVRRKFGLGAEQLGQVVEWVQRTNVHWGLDASSHQLFRLPPQLSAHTWQAGLDQLLVGATMADLGPRLGPGNAVPYGDIEGDDVEVAGSLAELLHQLGRAHLALTTAVTATSFAGAVAEAAAALCEVPDVESWQWRGLDQLLTDLSTESAVAGVPCPLPVHPRDMATLLAGRLAGSPGRVRFGTGAVTLSSLTAQRGVPHRVVCLIGLDGDLGGGGGVGADDLTASPQCVGDRDGRSEVRAQLLDALLAAGERLIICTTGRDLRTNARVPPAVPVAELCDLIDSTVQFDGQLSASEAIAVDHPRQAWSEPNFRPGELGVPGAWSFDAVALEAAGSRRHQVLPPPFLDRTLPSEPIAPLLLAELVTTLKNPVETLLRGRLGIAAPRGTELADDLVPLAAGALGTWALHDDLLRLRLAAGDDWTDAQQDIWREVQRHAGNVAPLRLGDVALETAEQLVELIVVALRAELGGAAYRAPETVALEIATEGRTIVGEIVGVCGQVLVEATASKLKPSHRLLAWLRLAALTVARPDVPWRAIVVGRSADTAKSAPPVDIVQMQLRDPQQAHSVLRLVVELHLAAHCGVVPALPDTTHALYTKGSAAAAKAWLNNGWGDGADQWVSFALGSTDLDDLLDPASPRAQPAIATWAHRIWSAFDETVTQGPRDNTEADVRTGSNDVD